MLRINEKKGQVWIETVIYTLIGLSLIAIILTFVTPKINEAKDKAIVSQTIASLNQFDEKINSALQAPGNVRSVEFTIKRGAFYINQTNNSLAFIIEDLEKPYSEPGVEISFGRVKIKTEESSNLVTLKIDYNPRIDITYNGNNAGTATKFDAAPIPYKFYIESKPVSGGLEVIDIKVSSGA